MVGFLLKKVTHLRQGSAPTDATLRAARGRRTGDIDIESGETIGAADPHVRAALKRGGFDPDGCLVRRCGIS
jgi:hypothetical protein